MGAGSAVLAAAQRPGLVSGLVLVGPFVRNGKASVLRRLGLRVAMAPPWAAISWKSYLPKLYAGQQQADFEGYRDQDRGGLRRPGHAKAFSATARTRPRPGGGAAGRCHSAHPGRDGRAGPRLPDPRAEADWIARALRAKSSWCPRPGITRSRSGPTSPPAQSCASWNLSRAVPRPAECPSRRGRIARRGSRAAEPEVTVTRRPLPPLRH